MILDTGNTNPIQPCLPFKVGMRVRRGISQHTVSNSMLDVSKVEKYNPKIQEIQPINTRNTVQKYKKYNPKIQEIQSINTIEVAQTQGEWQERSSIPVYRHLMASNTLVVGENLKLHSFNLVDFRFCFFPICICIYIYILMLTLSTLVGRNSMAALFKVTTVKEKREAPWKLFLFNQRVEIYKVQ